MNYNDVLESARKCIGPYCKACNECNGKACTNKIPGPGAKGIGDVAIRNYDMWKKIRLNMDVLVENSDIDLSSELFGHLFKYPIFAGPVGAVQMHYGDCFTDLTYNDILVKACANHGILAFTGDGVNEEIVKSATTVIKAVNGLGIPTIKPWNLETIQKKMALVEESGALAVAMDIDACGLPFLKNMTPKAGSKSVDELKEIVRMCKNRPFIVKGIMTVQGALKAIEAGASGIVVSNHGGRVLDQTLSTAEVLKDICDVCKGKITVLVDGGIRSGSDIFKALALGADGVLIARPFVTSVYGAKDEGVEVYISKLASELEETMMMCGARSIKDIHHEMIKVCF